MLDAEAQHSRPPADGGSPPAGIAAPSDPLSDAEIAARTSPSGWYRVDEDDDRRPVAYRRTPRFDDRTERTAAAGMLLKSAAELPEWVQCSNRLWLPRCFVSAVDPPRAESPPSVHVQAVQGSLPSDVPGPAGEARLSWGSDAGSDGEPLPPPAAVAVAGGAVAEPRQPGRGAAGTETAAPRVGCVWASLRILDTERVQPRPGKAGFTRYRLCTSTTDGSSWVLAKRYSDFKLLRARLIDANVPGVAEIEFPKRKLRKKTSVREQTVEVRTEALQHWLDALLTVQVDHELLDVFLGAQRQMRHLMSENRALQDEAVRLVRRTEVLVGECDEERRNRRMFEQRLEEVEAARKDAVAKMQVSCPQLPSILVSALKPLVCLRTCEQKCKSGRRLPRRRNGNAIPEPACQVVTAARPARSRVRVREGGGGDAPARTRADEPRQRRVRPQRRRAAPPKPHTRSRPDPPSASALTEPRVAAAQGPEAAVEAAADRPRPRAW